MNATEQLREVAQAGPPETRRRRVVATPWAAVLAAVLLVAAVAIGTTLLVTHTNDATPPRLVTHANRLIPPRPTPAASTGQIRGTLVISPAMAKQHATSGSIVITGPRRLTITVRDSGRFTATVPPGQYTVIGHAATFDSGRGDCITQTPAVDVLAHQIVDVTVTCLEK